MLDLTQGIANKLASLFDYAIYTEAIEQGMEEPSFFIADLNSQISKGVSNRYQESRFFDVQYFHPLNAIDISEAMEAVRKKLFEEMEYIVVDEQLIRLKGRRIEKINSILHYFFDIDIHYIKRKQEIKMQKIEQEVIYK